MPFQNKNPEKQEAAAPRRWPIRISLIGLVFGCLLPGIIGAGSLIFHEYREGRVQLERDTIHTARALVQTVDAQLLQAQVLARTLSTANSLTRGDLQRFHQRARDVMATVGTGSIIVLTDLTGQQIVNTLKDFGEPLPRHGNPESFRRVLATGKPRVSDLYVGGVLRRPVMSIDVPVVVNGAVVYVLSVGIQPQQFNTILKSQGLPGDWVAAIFDTTGTIVARTHAAEQFVGQKGTAEFIERIREFGEGSMETLTREGIPTLSVFSRSAVTGWSVGIGIPRQKLVANLERNLALLAAGVTVLFAIGFGLAWIMGARIGSAVRTLKALAATLGRGEVAALPAFRVEEAHEIACAMAEAARLLDERATHLRQKDVEIAAHSSALRQTVARLHTLTEHAPAAIAVFDQEMRYLAVSQRWREDYGVGQRDLIGQSHYEIFPEIPERWIEAHRRGLSGEVLRAEADRFERSDGSVQWIHWEIWPWRDDVGEVGGIIIVAEEITERVEALDALTRSQELLRLITDAVPALIAYIDPEYRYQLANETYERWFGLSPQAIIGQSVPDVLGDTAWQQLQPWMARAMEGGSVNFEMEVPYREGGSRWASVSYTPDRAPDGGIRGIAVLVIDITDRKKAEDEIHRLHADLENQVVARTAELEATTRELEAFTFATSHDFKGPLGRINSFCTLLHRDYQDRLEDNGQLFLDIIRQNATRLSHLVDDLLRHARIAQQSFDLQEVDLMATVRTAIDEKSEDIQGNGVEIHVDLPPARIYADPHALNQVLGNLVENALKYSSKASAPRIEVGGASDGSRFRLWVRDNGIGFKMEYHDKIFKMFQRLHTYTEYTGSGVGLALVKRAMERMNGKVWAESEPGQGATFFLELREVRT